LDGGRDSFADAAPAAISGVITNDDGQPLGGVTVNLSGGHGARTITDANGHYRFANVESDGFYVVTRAWQTIHSALRAEPSP